MGCKQPNFNKVLVLDTNRKPLMPCYPARAKKLLSSGSASVFRRNTLQHRIDGLENAMRTTNQRGKLHVQIY